jgi:hypothetical protein
MRVWRLDDVQVTALRPFVGNENFYVALAFEGLSNAVEPRLAIIPEQLASCDPDFLKIRFAPDTYWRLAQVCGHAYVARHAPELQQQQRRGGQIAYLNFLYAYKAGLIEVSKPEDFDRAIRELRLSACLIARNGSSTGKYLALKLGLVSFAEALRARRRKAGSKG